MKQGKNSWALMKLLIGTLFLAILLPALSHTETERDKKYGKYGGIWKDRLDEKTPDSNLFPPTPPPSLRKAAQKEITNLRDEVEDELRMYLLALYWDEKKIEKSKSILNNPWDKEGIEFLWNDIVEGPGDIFQENILLNLLIYVNTKYKDETITKIIRGKINGLLEKRLENPDAYSGTPFWNNLNQAIAKYGSPDFVSPAMWKYVEKAKGGRLKPVLKIFKLHPSEKGVNQLRAFVKDVSWEKDDKRRVEIEETIKLVESLLRYPVVQILMSYNQSYAKIVITQADEMKGTQEERIKFLEQEVDKYADSLVEAAKDQNRFIRDREKDIQEAQEIKAKLKEFKGEK